jgi:hypothetical protein
MARDDESLLDEESVERWIAKHDPDGIGKLHAMVNRGAISGARAKFVVYWFARRDAETTARKQAAERDLATRNVEAAERSAAAAVESAGHAADSARWAKWAVVLALCALAVSAVPFVREWL